MGDFLPSIVLSVVGEPVLAQFGGVDVASRQRVQRLDRMVTDSDVDEILLDECTDAGDIRIVRLFVQRWTAVTGKTARPTGAVGRRRKEELSAAPLGRRTGTVISGQEFV